MLKLKLQYFGYLMWTDDSLEKSLVLGKIEGRRRRGRQRMRWLGGITDAMNMNLGKLHKMVRERKAWVLPSMGSRRVGHNWAAELNWTELKKVLVSTAFVFKCHVGIYIYLIWIAYVVVVQSSSHVHLVQLFATPCTAAHQASLSLTISWSLLKFMSIVLLMVIKNLIVWWH